MLMCVGCFGLVVSTCQVIGYRKTPLMTPSWGEEIISTKPRWKSVFVCIFLSFGLFMLLCPPGPTQYIFHTPMARYSLNVLKVRPLSTKQTNKQTWRRAYLRQLLSNTTGAPYVGIAVSPLKTSPWWVIVSNWWLCVKFYERTQVIPQFLAPGSPIPFCYGPLLPWKPSPPVDRL